MQLSSDKHQQVSHVLRITLVLNVIVALSKITIGLMSGALAITADGLHSLVDGSGNVVGLIATRLADRPPDDDHPYGHGRYETLAALLIGALLLLTAWEIVRGALERLTGAEPPQITPLAFAVMLGTLVVNIFVSRYQIREGKRLDSQVLLADAANTRADVFVTISVIVSMSLVTLLGWAWADIAAALVITLLIGRAAWQVLGQTTSILVDTAPYSPDDLTRIVKAVPAVNDVVRVRSRGSRSDTHIDVDVRVAPEMTANQIANISEAIDDRLRQDLPGVSEVKVQIVPYVNHDSGPDYVLLARAKADALGLTTHEVRLTQGDVGRVLEMHVEVPPDQTLDEAHRQVSELEQKIQNDLDIVRVITHIEPALPVTDTACDHVTSGQARQLEQRIQSVLAEHHPGWDWHEVRVEPFNQGYAASMHVALPAQISVEAAHRIAEEAEILLRADEPQLERVMIHTEPAE